MLFVLLTLPILTVVSLSVNRPSSKDNSCPKGGVISSTDSNICYYLVSQKLSWYDADQFCQTWYQNGNLASITSAYENAVLFNYLKTVTSDQVWIGADSDYTSIDGYFWTWSDDRKFSYNNFQDSSLKTPPRDEIAVLFNPAMNGKWTIDDKANNYTLVCEIPLNGM